MPPTRTVRGCGRTGPRGDDQCCGGVCDPGLP